MKNSARRHLFKRYTAFGWTALALLVSSIQACNSSKSPAFDEDAKNKVVAEATAFLQDYYAAVCDDGLQREFEFLDSTSDFHWKPMGTEKVLTYDTISAMVRRNMQAIDSTCPTWTELTVIATANDSAHYDGKLHSWTATVDGDTISEDFEEVGNLIKRQGRWWLLNGETKAKL